MCKFNSAVRVYCVVLRETATSTISSLENYLISVKQSGLQRETNIHTIKATGLMRNTPSK